ncbi:hypothetical protein C8R45DRAFT_922742 [Mycena sanguinolenta]|nr:hypothetical protein C8R45DRAFT_922742 [Mycena sanguinolenta]
MACASHFVDDEKGPSPCDILAVVLASGDKNGRKPSEVATSEQLRGSRWREWKHCGAMYLLRLTSQMAWGRNESAPVINRDVDRPRRGVWTTSHCLILAGAKATKWLAKPTKWLAKPTKWLAQPNPSPSQKKPFGAGASHFGKPKMSLSLHRFQLDASLRLAAPCVLNAISVLASAASAAPSSWHMHLRRRLHPHRIYQPHPTTMQGSCMRHGTHIDCAIAVHMGSLPRTGCRERESVSMPTSMSRTSSTLTATVRDFCTLHLEVPAVLLRGDGRIASASRAIRSRKCVCAVHTATAQHRSVDEAATGRFQFKPQRCQR